ncbi:peroxide stress protein YaaA [Actinotalea sp. M2MS4P-6]|uniref:YaaA family protein n=1 Tax=Actinotalea sp. M2MS4P-6 TaxID=2983762 RepID=UPI0021E39891|nr:peroxide stress protein YaaA [Actinotalea sp. M2MS4P-6]MCV2393223.1 peroxide stress protein YaaA [Actinotalea sp. M2MS4P-6]
MLIVLPPSEAKAAPARRGHPVDPSSLSFPALAGTRDRVLAATLASCTRGDALRRFGVGPSLADELARDARILELPARPALEVFTGVLFDGLDAPTLSAAARRRAAARLVVVSGLWGALRPRDRIPPYRLNVCAALVEPDGAELGGLEPLWRAVLPEVLAEALGPRGLLVDLRSSSYLAMGRATAVADRTVEVRVLRDGPTGRSVVSHMAKHTRGLVARHLLQTGADPRSPEGLAEVLSDVWKVELQAPSRAGRPWTADVVVADTSS